MIYRFSTEDFEATYPEIESLYRQHYAEMADRLKAQGVEVSPYAPRLDEYVKASRAGALLTFLARLDGRPVGYANVYITNDMHNGDFIAEEDALFVLKEHRRGVGKALVKYGLQELRAMGCKRLNVAALTDLRVAKLWRRMGFKETAIQMTYEFQG